MNSDIILSLRVISDITPGITLTPIYDNTAGNVIKLAVNVDNSSIKVNTDNKLYVPCISTSTNKDGFYITDENNNIGLSYNADGLDVAKVSDHFVELMRTALGLTN